MKSLKLSALLALLFIFQSANCQEKKKNKRDNDHYMSFNINGENPNIDSGFWTATTEGDQICLQLTDNSSSRRNSFIIGYCVDRDQFDGVDMTAERFQLVRESGTMTFEGRFNGQRGTGEFTFTRNKDFENFLNSEGITEGTDYAFFKLFLGNVDRAYVNGIKKEGYQPTMKQLGKLGIHRVSLDYFQDLANTNYKGLDLNMILKFHIHGVTIDYINGLADLGYANLEPNMIKKFAVHSISLDYINGLKNAGYGNMEPNMLKNFAVHSISVDYIEELNKAGYTNLDPNMIKKFAIHSVSSKFINDLNRLGYENLDPNTIKNFAVHNVNANYIESLINTNINKPSTSALRKAKIHGVSAKFIERAMKKGHNTKDLSDYTKLRIHGI